MGVEADVRGPHRRKRLANGAKGVLHCSRADRVTMGGKLASSVLMCIDLQDGDWIGEHREGRIQ